MEKKKKEIRIEDATEQNYFKKEKHLQSVAAGVVMTVVVAVTKALAIVSAAATTVGLSAVTTTVNGNGKQQLSEQ